MDRIAPLTLAETWDSVSTVLPIAHSQCPRTQADFGLTTNKRCIIRSDYC
jgi:hypothetical protein